MLQRLDDGTFVAAVAAQLALLAEVVSELLSHKWLADATAADPIATAAAAAAGGAAAVELSERRRVAAAVCAASNRELDAAALLEWVARTVLLNAHRAPLVWPKMHGFLRGIVEDHVEAAVARCPYLLERCVVTVLRAAVALAPKTAPGPAAPPGAALAPHGTHAGAFRSLAAPAPPPAVSWTAGLTPPATGASGGGRGNPHGLSSVWLSLRLLRGVPSDAWPALADRVALGVHALLHVSPGTHSVNAQVRPSPQPPLAIRTRSVSRAITSS